MTPLGVTWSCRDPGRLARSSDPSTFGGVGPKADALVMVKIHAIHEQSRGTYGVPRVHAVLAADELRAGRKRVARLMKVSGLEGISRRKKYRTSRDKDA